MTDREWVEGMKQLVVAFPDRDLPPEVLESRGETYRRHLDDLTGAQWAHAVAEAVKSERWFPTIAALRDIAEGYMPPMVCLPAPECQTCSGSGWEHFERDGYAYVRQCHCRPVVVAG